MQSNVFEIYVLERIREFWNYNLSNEVSFDTVLNGLRIFEKKEEIEKYLLAHHLSEDSQELIYYFLLQSVKDIEIQTKRCEEYTDYKMNMLEVVNEFASLYKKPLYKSLYWHIFDITGLKYHYSITEDDELPQLFMESYKKTSLLIAKDDVIPLDEWVKREFEIFSDGNTEEKAKKDLNKLTVPQKLMLFDAMFEELGVRPGGDIDKSVFLRFFQQVTGTELHVDYNNSSFKKTYIRLYLRSEKTLLADLDQIRSFLKQSGLLRLADKIQKQIEAQKKDSRS